MGSFKSAVQDTEIRSFTENGMETLASSLNANVDLFFMIGASRGNDISVQFERAYGENRELALRILLWARDVRGGLGERETFRSLLKHLERLHPQDAEQLLPAVAEMGRWDDLLVFETQDLREKAFGLIAHALEEENGLCAKWMPRVTKPRKKDGVRPQPTEERARQNALAEELRRFLGLDPKAYRTLLSTLSNTVEQRMCAQDWDGIEFGKLPSIASARYQNAFSKHAAVQYQAYKDRLASGEEKVNAGAIYPHNVLTAMKQGDVQVSAAQWEALPNFLGDDRLLAMADVSGSMDQPVGNNKKLRCMDISIALGLYMADKQDGPFKDMLLTFDSNPKFQVLQGDIVSKMHQVRDMNWGGNTNLEAAFRLILQVAMEKKVRQKDMPKYLVILSDMEFDQADRGFGTAFETLAMLYEAAGYKMPKVVFWNLAAREDNVPVRYDEKGVALVSGFSPAVLSAILGAKQFDPKGIMLEAVMNDRYELPAPPVARSVFRR